MNEALLGAKLEPSPTYQAVLPLAGTLAESPQRKAAPPHVLTSMPRWVLYQARSLTGSLALMKTPPIPVTRFMATFAGWLFAGKAGSVFAAGAFTPEAGAGSWARRQERGRVRTVKAANNAFVLGCMMRGVMDVSHDPCEEQPPGTSGDGQALRRVAVGVSGNVLFSESLLCSRLR